MPDSMPNLDTASIAAELIAVIVAVTDGEPRVLTIEEGRVLPSGPFESGHRSLQAGLRSWVERQTHHPLGYVEQLYTFADGDRTDSAAQRVVSISYLGLTREARLAREPGAGWLSWYRFFPWEDCRATAATAAGEELMPRLRHWAMGKRERQHRLAVNFGQDGQRWNEELVLQRYELLWEAGLVPEAGGETASPGLPMAHDHRRILATGKVRDGGEA